MSMFSYKFRLRARSFLHPIRTLKALYFIHYVESTDKWKELVETNPKKAFEMKWNRFYREKFPWKNPQALNEKSRTGYRMAKTLCMRTLFLSLNNFKRH